MTCAHVACDLPAKSRGVCASHYNLLLRAGHRAPGGHRWVNRHGRLRLAPNRRRVIPARRSAPQPAVHLQRPAGWGERVWEGWAS